MRGDRPKPTALKILTGNPGKRPLPVDEPMPTGKAVMPKWLRKGAVVVWQETAPILEPLGLLTDMDVELFAQWCTLAAEFRKSPGKMVAGKMARMDAIAQRFGLDPASRARVKVSGQAKKDPADEFFAGPRLAK